MHAPAIQIFGFITQMMNCQQEAQSTLVGWVMAAFDYEWNEKNGLNLSLRCLNGFKSVGLS
jgi:hypothetical protein